MYPGGCEEVNVAKESEPGGGEPGERSYSEATSYRVWAFIWSQRCLWRLSAEEGQRGGSRAEKGGAGASLAPAPIPGIEGGDEREQREPVIRQEKQAGLDQERQLRRR